MNVVFHLSSSQGMAGAEALANVSNLLVDETVDVDSVALVANGGGVQHLRADADVADRIRMLIERDVEFKACQNAMNAQGISPDDLVDGTETVPSGVGGVANLEADGYLYIKVP
ncbi:MAG: DsrE family protein [Halalkalicoccus sp.]|nr:DsrE family protein [Halalkalicoccus sp.]